MVKSCARIDKEEHKGWMESHLGQKMRTLFELAKGRNPRAKRPNKKLTLFGMEVRKIRILVRSSVFIIMSLDVMLQNVQTRNPTSMIQKQHEEKHSLLSLNWISL